MRRRDFITLVDGAAAWPLSGRAQRLEVPVVGFLHAGAPERSAPTVASFRKGLNEVGFLEGRNVSVEYRWANNDFGRLPELAADLARLRVAIIATPGGTAAALAAKQVTATIPIVFGVAIDPVRSGLVASLNRPGGNITGVTYMGAELGSKRLGLLHELLPGAKRFGVLVNPTTPLTQMLEDLQPAAAGIGGEIEILSAATNDEIDAALASVNAKRIDALMMAQNTLFNNRRVQIVTLATRLAIPVIYSARDPVEIGGLLSYGPDQADQDRMTGIYVGRVLKGEKPADLPVMRATKFELVINLQTAKTLRGSATGRLPSFSNRSELSRERCIATDCPTPKDINERTSTKSGNATLLSPKRSISPQKPFLKRPNVLMPMLRTLLSIFHPSRRRLGRIEKRQLVQ